MLQLLQFERLDLEKEKSSLKEQVIKDQELLERLQSVASKVDQSLQSTVMNLDRIVSDSYLYQEQRSQYLAVLESELWDRVSVLLSYFLSCFSLYSLIFAFVELL